MIIVHLQHRVEALSRTLCGSGGDWDHPALKIAGAWAVLYTEVELCTKRVDGRYSRLESIPPLYFLVVSSVPDVQPVRGRGEDTRSWKIWHHLAAKAGGGIKQGIWLPRSLVFQGDCLLVATHGRRLLHHVNFLEVDHDLGAVQGTQLVAAVLARVTRSFLVVKRIVACDVHWSCPELHNAAIITLNKRDWMFWNERYFPFLAKRMHEYLYLTTWPWRTIIPMRLIGRTRCGQCA